MVATSPREPGPSGPDAERLWSTITSFLGDMRAERIDRLSWRSDLADDFALDSLALVELHDRIDAAFGVELPARVLAEARTPADWLDAVRRARAGELPPSGAAGPVPAPVAPSGRVAGSPWPDSAATLPEAFGWHAEQHPELVAIRLLGQAANAGSEELSYATLWSEAKACGRALIADGVAPGERVALMLPTCRQYFVVFMGVLLAGGVPVPLYPPARASVLEEHLRRQSLLLDNSGAVMLVAPPEAMLAGRLLRAWVPSLRSVRTPASLAAASQARSLLPTVMPDDIALIQYTSGSTGDPKGVVLTHAQLLANIRAMGQAARVDSADVFVSWLPLYHDMGLIGAWLAASAYFGMLLVIMSPLDFLARPAAWLEAITRHRGTISAAPNFAYQNCVDRVSDAELASLDLSSWRLTFNGSELVSATTVTGFSRRFASCGFRPEAMCPAYGLAEVGVGFCFSPVGQLPSIDAVRLVSSDGHDEAVAAAGDQPGSLRLVSCGVPLPGYDVRVVDEEGVEVADRHEGRVECRGPSATAGYFANERATARLLDGDWLDTGDAGYRADGLLFLTGRRDDVVIRAGRKLHPEELEQALEELDGVDADGAAVFGVTDPGLGTERLVVAAETHWRDRQALEELRTAVDHRCLELLGVAPDRVVFVAPGAIPRTASGKIRRSATRDAYLAGTLGRSPAPPLVQLVRFALGSVPGTARRLAGQPARVAYAMWAWILVLAVGIPIWLLVLLPWSQGTRWRLVRGAARIVQKGSGCSLRVQGALPDTGSGALVVANHPSFIDGLVLMLVADKPLVFVSSSDFERQHVAGTFLRRLGCVFVHRGQLEETRGDVEQLVERLEGAAHVAVFPEGGLHRGPGVGPFHLGAFSAAATTGCPVIPVSIRGTASVLAPGRFVPHRGPVEVVIGPPKRAASAQFPAVVELAEEVRAAIEELCASEGASRRSETAGRS